MQRDAGSDSASVCARVCRCSGPCVCVAAPAKKETSPARVQSGSETSHGKMSTSPENEVESKPQPPDAEPSPTLGAVRAEALGTVHNSTVYVQCVPDESAVPLMMPACNLMGICVFFIVSVSVVRASPCSHRSAYSTTVVCIGKKKMKEKPKSSLPVYLCSCWILCSNDLRDVKELSNEPFASHFCVATRANVNHLVAENGFHVNRRVRGDFGVSVATRDFRRAPVSSGLCPSEDAAHDLRRLLCTNGKLKCRFSVCTLEHLDIFILTMSLGMEAYRVVVDDSTKAQG
ncbi:hypothetical protein F2P81_002652 [Scophthalmus maximus]|uniref:Uncharacterized protein n=1 Tax=Scophthalmus maximus TaxID=52904 RepID=A0A6A4TJC7_SCOMX|nr:hypothetical protein F2P81_002652 [Scophthalmus maximus]